MYRKILASIASFCGMQGKTSGNSWKKSLELKECRRGKLSR